MKDGRVANAWIAYDGAAQNLTVFLTYDDSPSFDGRPCSLSFAVDLRQHLPDRVAVGFSAATGGAVELHQILYWEFTSTLDPDNTLIDIEIAIAIAAGFAVLISILGLILFLLRRRRRMSTDARRRKEAEEEEEGDSMAYDELAGEFEIGSGPRRFRFGIVALEIACGRRPVEPKEEPGRARLLPWAWEMHGRNAIQEAADDRLNKAFDEAELGRLVAVGLWCAHPDWTLRPSIRQAVAVLKFESPPPVLPPKMPVPVYFVPPIGYHGLSGAASSIADAGDSGFGTSSSSDRLLES
uniref:Legume lectin domain-containing protein n=1 Tax=Ananas comosus var. bracteatus TaxID=296719 RepID=A0A6V7PAQ1_ANACO|nr:unnamed protein product [Ananas comosus var. bracteatus]